MKPHRKKAFILWIILLAITCVSTAELIACRHFDPELFDTITAPVVTAASAASDAVNSAVQATVQAVDRISASVRTAVDEAKIRHEERKQQELDETPSEPSPPDTETDNQSVTAPLLNIPSSICDPSVTELKTVGDQQLLTGGPVKIIYYQQGDERWGNLKYGSDRISTHGCGPTAMAMVVSSMTDTLILPQEMAQWAVNNGHWAHRSGSYHSIVIAAATAFGLQAESYPLRDADALRQELMGGNLLVALVGPGHFTQSGHFIILRGVTLSGDILVADPGSSDRSLVAWDAQLILNELSKSTASGSPLWLISLPDTSNGE